MAWWCVTLLCWLSAMHQKDEYICLLGLVCRFVHFRSLASIRGQHSSHALPAGEFQQCVLYYRIYVHQRVGAQFARLCSGSQATGSIFPAVPQKISSATETQCAGYSNLAVCTLHAKQHPHPLTLISHQQMEQLFCVLTPPKITSPLLKWRHCCTTPYCILA